MSRYQTGPSHLRYRRGWRLMGAIAQAAKRKRHGTAGARLPARRLRNCLATLRSGRNQVECNQTLPLVGCGARRATAQWGPNPMQGHYRAHVSRALSVLKITAIEGTPG